MSALALKNGLIISQRRFSQTNIEKFFQLLDDKNFGTTKKADIKRIIQKLENDGNLSSQESNDSC